MILKLKPFFLSPWSIPATVLFWAIVVYISFINRSAMLDKVELEMARIKGESVFHIIQTTRHWGTKHGAVYVPETESTPENPYLFVPEKTIVSPAGRRLTQVNPAYMTRQLSELLEGSSVEISLTSKNLLNPGNKPDSWELQALNLFEQGMVQHAEERLGKKYRYMAPLYIEPGCQACHFGYAVGDIRGGISVTFPTSQITTITRDLRSEMIFFHVVAFLVLTAIGITLAISIRKLILSMDDSVKIREFLATMSHEVRTPMNAVTGLLEILSKDTLPDKQQNLVNVIRQSASVLLRILDDILDFSRIESGRLVLEAIPIRLVDIVNSVTTIFKPMCLDRGVSLTVHISDKVPDRVQGDPVRISQILHNLMSNAVKFSSGRADQPGEVRVSLDWLNDQLEICVRDNGIGISEQQIQKIFTPFSQADTSTARHYGGSGLGLSIVTNLIQMMKGDLKVDSEQGKGSTFRVRLPLSPLPDDHEAFVVDRELPQGDVIQSLDPSGFRILVAEDDKVNQMVIEQQLGLIGYEYQIANDGAEAFKVWQAAPQRFDLILTDLHMPHMDGVALVEAIRKAESPEEEVPIILLTANVLSGVADIPSLKLSGQLTKPVHLDALAAMLSKVLAKPNTLNSESYGSASLTQDFPLYDPDVLKNMVGDNPETLNELKHMYLQVSEEQMHRLEEIWSTSDAEQRVVLLHKLKSSSRSTGALHLGQLFEHYEHLSRESSAALPAEEWRQLKQAYDQFVDRLRSDMNG